MRGYLRILSSPSLIKDSYRWASPPNKKEEMLVRLMVLLSEKKKQDWDDTCLVLMLNWNWIKIGSLVRKHNKKDKWSEGCSLKSAQRKRRETEIKDYSKNLDMTIITSDWFLFFVFMRITVMIEEKVQWRRSQATASRSLTKTASCENNKIFTDSSSSLTSFEHQLYLLSLLLILRQTFSPVFFFILWFLTWVKK